MGISRGAGCISSSEFKLCEAFLHFLVGFREALLAVLEQCEGAGRERRQRVDVAVRALHLLQDTFELGERFAVAGPSTGVGLIFVAIVYSIFIFLLNRASQGALSKQCLYDAAGLHGRGVRDGFAIDARDGVATLQSILRT